MTDRFPGRASGRASRHEPRSSRRPAHRPPAVPPPVEDAAAAGRADGGSQAQYGAWMAEPRQCPACASANVAIDGTVFGGLWCLDCRHEWHGGRFATTAAPDWWRLRG